MTKKQRISKTQSKSQEKSGISPIIIGVVVVAALLLVGGLVLLGNQSRDTAGPLDLTGYPTIGDDNAPVTMIDFSDFG